MTNIDLLTRLINTFGGKLQDAQFEQKGIWPALGNFEVNMVPIRDFVLQARNEMRRNIHRGAINT